MGSSAPSGLRRIPLSTPAPTEASGLLPGTAPVRRPGAPLYDTSDDDDHRHFDSIVAGQSDVDAIVAAYGPRTAGSGAAHLVHDDEVPLADDENRPSEGLLAALGLLSLGRYALGVFLLVIVAIIWVAASEWIKYIFGALDFNKPYFMTFLNTGMFALYNTAYPCMRWWRSVPWAYPGEAEAEPFFSLPRRRLAEVEQASPPAAADGGDGAAAQGASPVDSTEAAAATVQQPESQAATATNAGDGHQEPLPRYSRRELLRCAMCFCPLWFLANVLFNYSLSQTSVSSNTILSTTSSFWTLVFAWAFLKQRIKVLMIGALVLNLGGTVMVAYGDDSSGGGKDSLIGDALALLSAFFYASYTTVLRFFLPDEDRYSMPMVFGMVGIVNLVLMWPGLVILSVTGIEPFEWPSWNVLWPLVLNGLVGTNLSDVLWAKAVILTSPFVATLGLSLTTPFAMVADLVIHQTQYTFLYITGAIVVMGGFITSNL